LSISRWQEIPSDQDLKRDKNDGIQSLFLVLPRKNGIQGSRCVATLASREKVLLNIDLGSIICFPINLARLQFVYNNNQMLELNLLSFEETPGEMIHHSCC
jgi:hypothetical protein